MTEETTSPEPTESAPVDAFEAAYAAGRAEPTEAAQSQEETTEDATSEGQESTDTRSDLYEHFKRNLSGEAEEASDSDSTGDGEKGEEESEPESEEGESEEAASDGDTEAKEEASEDEESSEVKADAEVEVVKMLEASAGDKKIEMPSNATFKHKVDGEEVDVSVQELLNNYSGKVAYDRKFQELDVKKTEFETDRNLINDNVNHFFELASAGQEMQALDFLLERAGKSHGLDRNTFLQGFSKQLEPQLQEWMTMTDEQKQVSQLQSENDYFKRQRESEAQQQTDEKTQRDLEQHVSKIQEVHGLDQAQFVEYYDQVVSNPKTIEGLSPTEVLGLVDRYVSNTKTFTEVKEVLSGIDADIANDENAVWDFVDTVRQVGGDLTKKELQEVAREVYGIDKIANDLSDRVNKNNSASTKKSAPKASAKKQAKANLSRFEQFAEELRNEKIER